MKKRLMILGASNANRMALLEFAGLQNTECIVLDGNPDSIAKPMFQYFHHVDITDSSKVLSLAEQYNIDGIYSMNDHALRSASVVSTKLCLRGLNPASAQAALDKGTMREVWKTAGILQPKFRIIVQQEEAIAFCQSEGFPVVIKPVDCGGGGRGVYVIKDEREVETGFQYASRFLNRNNRMIIEKFIEGTEASIEYFAYNGKSYLVAYSDKFKPPLNSRVATKICYPGLFKPSTVEKMGNACREAADALGIAEGVAHVECIVDPSEQVYLVELGARVGGGHTFHPIASHVSGISYPQLIADYFCGQDISEFTISDYRGAAYYFTHSDAAGILRRVTGLEKARSTKGVALVELWKQPGDQVSVLADSMARTGCIVALDKSRDSAANAAEKALRELQFTVDKD
ncbi:ATP-grasp domain-containing protein [bacterium]|nr:ATP-grasp domain-containing protein [bacterium]